MAKPKRSRLKKKQNEDRLRAGHGDPESERYKPFLLIHDFSSLGRISRIRYEDRVWAHITRTKVQIELLSSPACITLRPGPTLTPSLNGQSHVILCNASLRGDAARDVI